MSTVPLLDLDMQSISIINAPSRCVICLDCEADLVFTCQHDHSVCQTCLQRCIEHRIKLKDTSRHPFQCPGLCSDTFELAHPSNLQVKYREELTSLLDQHSHPATIACPECTAPLRTDGPNFPNLQCSACMTQCCYFHGLGHRGKPCRPVSESLLTRFKTWVYLKRHTVQCEKCKRYVQRDGGCSHMTCSCGHQFCWHCGGGYAFGTHGRKLLCGPSEMQRQCNDWTLWTKRIALFIGLIPALPFLAVGSFLVYAVWPLLLVVGRTVAFPFRKCVEAHRVRQADKMETERNIRIKSQGIECSNARAYFGRSGYRYPNCLTCLERTTCLHARLDRNYCCLDCHHFDRSKIDGCLEHYYAVGTSTTCFFCKHRA
eukprot:m.224420 g.224420  ORF g.224420 m.224420 type:complete len:372 (-) comp17288_c0_seq2:3933-5048(-)